uniref:phospholipid phosphatase 3-like n=1 Tax=Myxine glutinosa TaxID=7769 RepID=UPI00358E4AD6
MDLGRVHPVVSICLDVLCLILAWLTVIVLNQSYVRPFQRGFFCDDESIRYPHRESTITHELLYSLGVLAPVLSIIAGELYYVRYLNYRPQSFMDNPYVATLYRKLGAFLFGMGVSQSFTNVAKFACGRLRPHFFAVCRPNSTLYNCSDGYIAKDVCMEDPIYVDESRKSFYSGHSSFAMYTMVFLVLYLEARLTWRVVRTLRPLLQFMLLIAAVYVGLSRVSDYKHYWSDVLMGFLQGVAVAIFAVFAVSGLFDKSQVNEPEVNDVNDDGTYGAVQQRTMMRNSAQNAAALSSGP